MPLVPCSIPSARDANTNKESASRRLAAANAGDSESAFNVAAFYDYGGVALPKDRDRSRYWFALPAELNSAEAQWH